MSFSVCPPAALDDPLGAQLALDRFGSAGLTFPGGMLSIIRGFRKLAFPACQTRSKRLSFVLILVLKIAGQTEIFRPRVSRESSSVRSVQHKNRKPRRGVTRNPAKTLGAGDFPAPRFRVMCPQGCGGFESPPSAPATYATLRRARRPLVLKSARRSGGGLLFRRVLRGYRISETAVHSTIRSARSSREGGTVMPSARAVFRLTTNSTVVACSTGSSAGFAPFTMRST